ncbi:uncharacterized protein PgNI_07373 [Pyricularia grisea]|uniref:LysM domain-containing protein n=1 Tax=Pyricularia grisea TaxID=148305 RepID=A0A6P8B198_PYRGI|nr:uncharacterized protein PgNI_07373 [Pyricularia grisea]TLD08606.1 hypothetical protein PgNI_07373 [Pyricularia grisea]
MFRVNSVLVPCLALSALGDQYITMCRNGAGVALNSGLSAVALLLLDFPGAAAQQLVNYVYPHELLGLSTACFAAVNTTVSSCPSWLAPHSGLSRVSFEMLKTPQLTALCGGSCQTELTALQSTIAKACTGSSDVMVYDDHIAYPATFLVDRFLFAASLSCLKESGTGLYCDEVVSLWPNETETWTEAQRCHECQLGIMKQQLASPFGYEEDEAADYASTTSSCSKTQYAFATPTSYALNSTTPSPSQPTCGPDASGSYTVQDGDSCNSISEAQGVATEAFISINDIDLGCNDIPTVGTSLCLPKKCKVRELGLGDTCESIIEEEGITLVTITDGGTCAAASVAFGITLDDFYFLNPQVDSSCSNLWLGYAYCVAAVGDIQTYPGYPVTAPATSFTRPPAEPEPTSTFELPPPGPRASGTIEDCFFYEDAWPFEFVAENPGWNSCERWAKYGGVTVEELVAWNPSLEGVECELKSGFSYCVQKEVIDHNDGEITTTTTTSSSATGTSPGQTSTTALPSPTTGPSPPAETQPGAIESCKTWYVVVPGDGCWAISNQYGIALDDFYKWNPAVGSDCGKLWPDYAVVTSSGARTLSSARLVRQPLHAPSAAAPKNRPAPPPQPSFVPTRGLRARPFVTPASCSTPPMAATEAGAEKSTELAGIDKGLACWEQRHPAAPWGMAVFRTDYGDDDAWRRVVAALQSKIPDSLELYRREDLLARHRLVFVEDRAALDGASVADVRERFARWSLEEARRNTGDDPVLDHEQDCFAGVRYNYCLVVDKTCLDAIERPGFAEAVLLKLVAKRHDEGIKPDYDEEDRPHPGWDGGTTDNELENVGWMYVDAGDYVNVCHLLNDPDVWEDDFVYVRPVRITPQASSIYDINVWGGDPDHPETIKKKREKPERWY